MNDPIGGEQTSVDKGREIGREMMMDALEHGAEVDESFLRGMLFGLARTAMSIDPVNSLVVGLLASSRGMCELGYLVKSSELAAKQLLEMLEIAKKEG